MGVPSTPARNTYNTAKRVGTRFLGQSSRTGWTPANAVIVSSHRSITAPEVQPSMAWRSPTSTIRIIPPVSALVSLPQATITLPARVPVTNNTHVIPWRTGGATGTKVPAAFTSTDRGHPDPASVDVDISKLDVFNILELERQASYFVTGGLVAVHARGRNRDAIWESLKNKEVYGTSGQRMLLWFDLLGDDEHDETAILPMGTETVMSATPRFRARALGAFMQNPGCAQYSINALSPERLDLLCRGECYNPSSERIPIQRIEVIRIRPQSVPGEPVDSLIEDPWKSFDCDITDNNGCTIEFEDLDFAATGRDAVYYVRALQESQESINAGGLRCDLDEQGQCIQGQCRYGDDRTDAERSLCYTSPGTGLVVAHLCRFPAG